MIVNIANKAMNEEEYEKFLHELFEEIYRKYVNGLYSSKLYKMIYLFNLYMIYSL